jgi:transposase
MSASSLRRLPTRWRSSRFFVFVADVVVGNPLQIRATSQAKVKTDKIGAEVHAHLLRCDYLPTVWQPDADTRRLRHLATVR